MSRKIGVWILGLFFLVAGFNHFRAAAFYVRIMPPALPAPLLLVQISGIAEMILGAAFLVAQTRRRAAIGLIALLLAVFPANIYMATHASLFSEFPPVLLWLRLPLQFVLMAWIWRAARPASS